MTTRPPVVQPGGEVYVRGQDEARYVVPPKWFEHPSLTVPNGGIFIWPMHVEGFRLSGSAQLGIHRYLGDDQAVVEVTHRSESRIEMSGVFPGKTGPEHMRDLRDVIEARTPEDGKILRLPGIFPNEQFVVVENWDFNHAEEDRTEEIAYTIMFIKTGSGKRVKRKKVIQPPANPHKRQMRGKGNRVFRVRVGLRTLRGISNKVYGNSNLWHDLYALNTHALNSLGIPFHQMPTRVLPLGLALRY